MDTLPTERYVSDTIPNGKTFEEWVASLLAFNPSVWGLTDQDYTKIAEQFGVPRNDLWYLPEGNYRLFNAPVSVIGADPARAEFVNIFVYSIDAQWTPYTKMIIMETQGNKYLAYNDSSNPQIWENITDLGNDGQRLVMFHCGEEPPEDKSEIWVDLRDANKQTDPTFSGYVAVGDPAGSLLAVNDSTYMELDRSINASGGKITLRHWTSYGWVSYTNSSLLLQEIYDTRYSGQDPYDVCDAVIAEYLAIYAQFERHIANTTALIHVTDAIREEYNTFKIYRADLNTWISSSGYVYTDMVAYINSESDRITKASILEEWFDEIDWNWKLHTTTTNTTHDIRLKLDSSGTILIDDDGKDLIFDGTFIPHVTTENVSAWNSKANSDHTHTGNQVTISPTYLVDVFHFDHYNTTLLASQTNPPRAVGYGAGLFMILGYGSDDLFISADEGRTWESSKISLGSANYTNLIYDETNCSWTAIASNGSGGISYDNGKTWTAKTGLRSFTTNSYQYAGKTMWYENDVIHFSMDKNQWYVTSLAKAAAKEWLHDEVYGAVNYLETSNARLYGGAYGACKLIMIGRDTGSSQVTTPIIAILNTLHHGIQKMDPCAMERHNQVADLGFLETSIGTETMIWGEDTKFKDSANHEFYLRRDLHNGCSIYMIDANQNVSFYKIIDSTKFGTASYMDGLKLMSFKKNSTDWSEITDKPTTLEGYHIDPDQNQIVSREEWNYKKYRGDVAQTRDVIVTLFGADECRGRTIQWGSNASAIYFRNVANSKLLQVKVMNQDLTGDYPEPYQVPGVSVNDNVDLPSNVIMATLSDNSTKTITINGFTCKFIKTTYGGVTFKVDTTEYLASLTEIYDNLKDSYDLVAASVNTKATACATSGKAMGVEYMIPPYVLYKNKMYEGLVNIQDVCFGNGTFVAVGMFTETGSEISYPVAFYSTNGAVWSKGIFINRIPTTKIRIAYGINGTNKMFLVATDNGTWSSVDSGLTWKRIHYLEEQDPVKVIFGNNWFYVFYSNNELIYRVSLTSSSYSLSTEEAPFDTEILKDVTYANGKLVALVQEDPDDTATIYYKTNMSSTANWSTSTVPCASEVNRIIYDYKNSRWYISFTDAEFSAQTYNASPINWAIAHLGKNCAYEAVFSESGPIQVAVNIGVDQSILPTSNYSNATLRNRPFFMTGTITTDAIVEFDDSTYVAGCYGNGKFVIFSPRFSSEYTAFYVSSSTNSLKALSMNIDLRHIA